MKKLINKLSGDDATPAKKAVVLAALITAAALVVCGITLAVSAVIFAINDRNSDIPFDEDTPADSGTPDPTPSVTYTTVGENELRSELDSLSSGKSRADRTISGNKLYYAYKNPDDVRLANKVLAASHAMLTEFYTKSSSKLSADKYEHDYTVADKCSIPLIDSVSADGTRFKLVVYSDESTTHGNNTYSWIYTNAASYGFVCNKNEFTYVGVAIAQYMKKNNIATLDALAAALSAQSGNVGVNAKEVGASNATAYQIYYMASGGEYKLPSSHEYIIIKNGTAGYFVSVSLADKVTAN